jgi:hypothetical protein
MSDLSMSLISFNLVIMASTLAASLVGEAGAVDPTTAGEANN